MTVPAVALAPVDPRVGRMGPDFAVEELLDTRGDPLVVHRIGTIRQWHALGVPELRVRLAKATLVTADGRRFVAFRERRQDRLPDRCAKLDASLSSRPR